MQISLGLVSSQTDRHIDRQTDRHTHTYIQTNKQRDRRKTTQTNTDEWFVSYEHVFFISLSLFLFLCISLPPSQFRCQNRIISSSHRAGSSVRCQRLQRSSALGIFVSPSQSIVLFRLQPYLWFFDLLLIIIIIFVVVVLYHQHQPRDRNATVSSAHTDPS